MPFKGIIKSGVAYTVDVTPEINNNDSTALTFASIVRRDRLREVDTLTIPKTQPSATRTDTLGTAVVRLDIFIYPPPNGLCQFRLVQGTTVITHDVTGDTTLTFDVTP
jgi:hypothetical protein